MVAGSLAGLRSNVVSVFESVTTERGHGLRGPGMKRLLLVLVLAGVVMLFLVLRGGDRRSFTFTPSMKLLPSVGSVVLVRLGSPGSSAFEGASPAAAREAGTIARSNSTLARLVRWATVGD